MAITKAKSEPVKAEASAAEAAPKASVKAEPLKAAKAPKAPKAPRAARKAAPKAGVKLSFVLQYRGRELSQEDMVAAAKAAWAAAGNDENAVESMDFYIKPEDGAVYSVVNGRENGKIDL